MSLGPGARGAAAEGPWGGADSGPCGSGTPPRPRRAFTTLCYAADGQSILAGGMSRFVCIYHVREQMLLKRFEISRNLSLDAMEEFLSRRKMTEFGNLALIDQDAGEEDGVAVPLPGVKKGEWAPTPTPGPGPGRPVPPAERPLLPR